MQDVTFDSNFTIGPLIYTIIYKDEGLTDEEFRKT